MLKDILYWIYHYEDDENLIGVWRHWYIFGKKIKTDLRWLWKY